jgi:ferredoxin
MRRASAGVVVLLALPAMVLAEEAFPPPDFTTGYQFPQITTPGPREQIFSYVDIGVLVLTLALATYLSIWKRSRRELVVLVIFSLAYFGFYRKGCICAIGAIQNVALALGNAEYQLPLVAAAFILLPLLFALFFGRVFCAAVCPLGAIQDIVLLRPIKVPGWLESPLGLMPFVYLGAAVLFAYTDSAFIICQYDPFVAFFRLGGSTAMLIFGAAVLLVATVIGRPYCRFACPYSALLRMLAPLARWRPYLTREECVQCNLCAEACPFGAIKAPTPAEDAPPRRAGKGTLAGLLVLLPLLVVMGGLLGWGSSPVLSRVHYKVRLAERIWAEEQRTVEGTTDESDAFYHLADLYREAGQIRERFDTGSALLGAWVGLVIGVRLIAMSVRRRREGYEIDLAACMACGRCYESCPLELARKRGDGVQYAQDKL